MRQPVVVDGRRTFDPAAMRAAGVRYRAIGLGGATVTRTVPVQAPEKPAAKRL